MSLLHQPRSGRSQALPHPKDLDACHQCAAGELQALIMLHIAFLSTSHSLLTHALMLPCLITGMTRRRRTMMMTSTRASEQ